MSPLHLCQYLLGSLLWPMLMLILLMLMCIISCPLIGSMSFLNLVSFLELIPYDRKNTSQHGKQLSQLASIASCHLLPLPSLIKNGEIFLLELWISNHSLLHVPRLDNKPVIYLDQHLMTWCLKDQQLFLLPALGSLRLRPFYSACWSLTSGLSYLHYTSVPGQQGVV